MSYLKYANLCADMVRGSLKEPTKTKAKLREAVYYRAATWKDGKPEKQGQHLDLFCNSRILPATEIVHQVLEHGHQAGSNDPHIAGNTLLSRMPDTLACETVHGNAVMHSLHAQQVTQDSRLLMTGPYAG